MIHFITGALIAAVVILALDLLLMRQVNIIFTGYTLVLLIIFCILDMKKG